MARHFGAQHTASNYSAMGNSKRIGKPNLTGAKRRTVAEAIAHARHVAAREAAAKTKKKK